MSASVNKYADENFEKFYFKESLFTVVLDHAILPADIWIRSIAPSAASVAIMVGAEVVGRVFRRRFWPVRFSSIPALAIESRYGLVQPRSASFHVILANFSWKTIFFLQRRFSVFVAEGNRTVLKTDLQ